MNLFASVTGVFAYFATLAGYFFAFSTGPVTGG